MNRSVALETTRGARTGALLLAMVGFVVGFGSTIHVLWWMWMNNPNYSHGFLIPPVTAWLIWRQRAAFKEATPVGSWAGCALLVPGVILQVLGLRGDVAMLQGLALILVIMGVVWQIFGSRVFTRVAVPLAFLIFMIPTFPFVINVVSFRLKLLAATGAVAIAQEIGVAVQRQGVNLLLADGVLAVENACSGLRSLIALLALGALFAYLSRGTLVRRCVLLLLALPIAVAANILRISGLCVYAGLTSVEQAAGAFHLIGGYVLFALAFLMLAAAKRTLRC